MEMTHHMDEEEMLEDWSLLLRSLNLTAEIMLKATDRFTTEQYKNKQQQRERESV